MGFTGKTKKSKSSDNISSNDNWGMGFLLVFFPEENQSAIVDENKLFSSSSSSIRRNSSSLLLAKAQSTVSICALLVFISLLLFTLSTFEPAIPVITAQSTPARRFLAQRVFSLDNINNTVRINPRIRRNSLHHLSWFAKLWKQKPIFEKSKKISATALQGMGNLYRRGTRGMNDLVVCHVLEETAIDEFRLYLRILHRSGLTSKSDIVIIFPSRSISSRFNSIVQEESDSFLKLIRHHREINSMRRRTGSGFDPAPFLMVGKKEAAGEPVWGKKIRTNFNDSNPTDTTRLIYGSVVSFEAADLDPENGLSGFSDHVPMNLRRWASYPMLLGRLRRNFKHVILVEVKNTFLFGDPLGRVRNKPPESVFIYRKPEQISSKHKRNSEKTQSNSQPAILMGGSRGVRRLSDAMLAAIVRTLMQQRKKSSVSESELLSQLAGNEYLSKSIYFLNSPEYVPEFHPDVVLSSKSAGFPPAAVYTVMQHGNGKFEEFNNVIGKKICLSELDSYVYSDCQQKST